jgi:GT2 family glycosyltransferase
VGKGGGSPVAIVIVTRDRCRSLLFSLERLAGLQEGHRVVVVDNGSADDTCRLVRERHPEITLIELGRNLGSAARTAGVRAVEEPYVAFSDDDSWWAPGSLVLAQQALDRHPQLGLVAGRVLVGPAAGEDPTCALMDGSPLAAAPGQPGSAVLGFLACAAVVRRSAYLAAGGFHPCFGIGGEEKLLALDLAAAGWQLSYLPDVVAHHHPPSRPDPGRRRRLQVRNGLWCAWLRRPLAGAVGHTISMTRLGVSDKAVAAGLRDALGGLLWVCRERRPVRRELERELRLLGDLI